MMLKRLKLNIMAVSVSLLTVISCSNTKTTSSDDFKLSEIVITHAYVQESVAGIEGGASIFEFLMNIELPSSSVIPDSVFYKGMGAKLTMKDGDTKQYYGRTSMKISDLDLDKKLTVKMNFNGNTFTLSPEYKVMDKMYMP